MIVKELLIKLGAKIDLTQFKKWEVQARLTAEKILNGELKLKIKGVKITKEGTEKKTDLNKKMLDKMIAQQEKALQKEVKDIEKKVEIHKKALDKINNLAVQNSKKQEDLRTKLSNRYNIEVEKELNREKIKKEKLLAIAKNISDKKEENLNRLELKYRLQADKEIQIERIKAEKIKAIEKLKSDSIERLRNLQERRYRIQVDREERQKQLSHQREVLRIQERTNRQIEALRRERTENLLIQKIKEMDYRKQRQRDQERRVDHLTSAGLNVMSEGYQGSKNVIKDSLNTFGGYEQQLNAVQAYGALNKRDMKPIRKLIENISMEGFYKPVEVARSTAELTRSGYKGNELKYMLPQSSDFAIASGVRMDQASTMLSDVMHTFNIKDIKRVKKVSDILSTALNESALNFEDFAYSMKYMGASSKVAGINLKEMTKFLAVTSQAGIKGSTAGTGGRKLATDIAVMFSELDQPNRYKKGTAKYKEFQERKEGLAEFGFKSSKDAMIDGEDDNGVKGKTFSLNMVLAKIFQSMEDRKMTAFQRIEKAKQLFGRTAQGAGSVVGGMATNNPREFIRISKAIDKNEGATQKSKDIMGQGYQVAVDKLSNSIELLKIRVGEDLAPFITNLAKGIKYLVDQLNDNTGLRAFLSTLALMTPIMFGLGLAFLKIRTSLVILTSMFPSLLPKLGSLSRMFMLNTGIIRTLITVIGGAGLIGILVSLGVYLASTWDKQKTFGENMMRIWNDIRGTIEGVVNYILSAFGTNINGVFDNLLLSWEKLKSAFSGGVTIPSISAPIFGPALPPNYKRGSYSQKNVNIINGGDPNKLNKVMSNNNNNFQKQVQSMNRNRLREI
jgi:TP901 family phage tail tape measure protein